MDTRQRARVNHDGGHGLTAGGDAATLWLQRVDDHGVWVVTQGSAECLQAPDVKNWVRVAARIFSERPEIASVSIVPRGAGAVPGHVPDAADMVLRAVTVAALPICLINGRIGDLIDLNPEGDQQSLPIDRFQRWIERATLKGLVHVWLVAHIDNLSQAGLPFPLQTVPPLQSGDTPFAGRDPSPIVLSPSTKRPISLGIEAARLMVSESGTQVFVFEMIRELARRADIGEIVLLSDEGRVPPILSDVPKVRGLTWSAALDGRPRLDILHRPYQPGADADYRRYHRAANCVAITVLDFIGYDNPAYHESHAAWRQYQQDFDERVCLADRVFALSGFIGSRIDRQFAHRLSGPVRAIHLGTDHMVAPPELGLPSEADPRIASLENQEFLLVLGNDFEHKNRDFAVKVFGAMCARGYEGALVLAGQHLYHGSTFDHELSGAEDYAGRIVRTGSVSAIEKTWLLSRAQVVLYPTSSEGFGLVPFEAAALGTPTAFVRFGSLREILPEVDACSGWHVQSFADHVFKVMAEPMAQVEQIRAAGARLTWASCVDQIVENYQDMLRDGTPWQAARPSLPGDVELARRSAVDYLGRQAKRFRRIIRRLTPGSA